MFPNRIAESDPRVANISWGRLRILITVALTVLGAARADTLHIGRSDAYSPLVNRSIAVLQVAYQHLGITPVFDAYPLRRSIGLANTGQLDGETHRVKEVGDQYKQLILINVPINHFELAAYGETPCPSMSSWSDLGGKRISYIRGVLAAEHVIDGMHANEAQHTKDVLHTIRRGIVDFGILVDYEADVAIQQDHLKDICRVKPLGERIELYHYLNIRHAELAKRLEAELTRMQAHGEIEAILDRETRRVLSGGN